MIKKGYNWISELKRNPVLCMDFLRIYLGVSLLLKGINFIMEPKVLSVWMETSQFFAMKALIAHYVVLAHLTGGLLLTLGLVTRIAALVQVPVLLGAVIFVHSKEGFFTTAQNLELTTLVLVLLVFFSLAGGGPLSLDQSILKK